MPSCARSNAFANTSRSLSSIPSRCFMTDCAVPDTSRRQHSPRGDASGEPEHKIFLSLLSGSFPFRPSRRKFFGTSVRFFPFQQPLCGVPSFSCPPSRSRGSGRGRTKAVIAACNPATGDPPWERPHKRRETRGLCRQDRSGRCRAPTRQARRRNTRKPMRYRGKTTHEACHSSFSYCKENEKLAHRGEIVPSSTVWMLKFT